MEPNKRQDILTAILRDQVVPALGCTEPGAVAYAVARAKDLLGNEQIKKLRVHVDKNTLKNGMDVGIPGTTEKGLVFASALAITGGKSAYKLEGLKDVTKEDIEKASGIAASSVITLEWEKEAKGLYILVDAFGGTNKSRVIIKGTHTNIVFESANGKTLLNLEEDAAAPGAPPRAIRLEIQNFSFDELIDYVSRVPLEEIRFLKEGITMNMKIAQKGVSEKLGEGIGRYFYSRAETVYEKARALTAAASEARMSGYPLTVMSSACSGNNGLMAILPAAIIGEGLNIAEEKIIRAVALSHLITIYAKVLLGTLSPVCGCGIAAGMGCAAAVTFLKDGSKTQIKNTLTNMTAGISGMICDGAKIGCCCKLAVAFDAALEASNMALNNIVIPPKNGILGMSAEQTLRNFAKVSSAGMSAADEVIIDVMLNHRGL